jgi:hypothetical protein
MDCNTRSVICAHADVQSLLKLRSVSKDWNKIVDKCIVFITIPNPKKFHTATTASLHWLYARMAKDQREDVTLGAVFCAKDDFVLALPETELDVGLLWRWVAHNKLSLSTELLLRMLRCSENSENEAIRNALAYQTTNLAQVLPRGPQSKICLFRFRDWQDAHACLKFAHIRQSVEMCEANMQCAVYYALRCPWIECTCFASQVVLEALKISPCLWNVVWPPLLVFTLLRLLPPRGPKRFRGGRFPNAAFGSVVVACVPLPKLRPLGVYLFARFVDCGLRRFACRQNKKPLTLKPVVCIGHAALDCGLVLLGFALYTYRLTCKGRMH